MFDTIMPTIKMQTFMPTTGTKPKKHLNKHRLGAKLRKKHKKATRNR